LLAPGIAVLLCISALLLLRAGMALAQGAAPAATDAVQAEISTITSATRTYSWTITKTVEPRELDLPAGESRNLSYTIHLTRSTQTSEAQVSGAITLSNPGGPAANITSVTVDVQNMGTALVNCGGFPFNLAANGQVICTYTKDVVNAAPRQVTATVYIDNAAGPTASALADFTPPTVENPVGPKSVFVTDPMGALDDFRINGTRNVTYTVPFTCPTAEGSYSNGLYTTTLTNTATLSPTNQAASVNVPATCRLPEPGSTVLLPLIEGP
jgi:hypothetical protein